jgi:uncharacterized protein (DUF362 family)
MRRRRIAHTTFDRANVAIMVAVVGAGAASLWWEGYLGRIDTLFALVGLSLGGLAAYFTSFTITTRRLAWLVVVAGVGGWLTQAVGASAGGFWHYPPPHGTYRFVPAMFVIASVVCYGLAQTGLGRALGRRIVAPPRGRHALIPLLAFGLLVVLSGSDGERTASFWIYYAVITTIAAGGATIMPLATLLSILLGGVVIGAIAESAGGAAGLWTFTSGPGWRPPPWLIFGSWPLEVTAHFTAAALLAGESILDRPRYFVEETVYPPRVEHPMWCGGQRRKVVCVTGDDKLALLREAIDRGALLAALDRRCAALGRDRADLVIALKPNFMFMYSPHDRSTFTDPVLVEELVDWLREHGFARIDVVEAQSAYGNYFHGREVAHVAEVVGYQPRGRYRVVDLTLEAEPYRFSGPLGAHVVGRTWRDADFRISFAKNKTHTWAWYTLCIKNIYGVLPMQDKIHEYHHKREIYYPTIDMLIAFPVHYGIIDAFVSADGPFGIFADREPNQTRTILAGENVVAIDWAGACKMGLDPMISRYMQLAVQAFGRPEVDLDGDPTPYAPWVNVPRPMIEFWDNAEECLGFTNTVFSVINHNYMSKAFPPRRRTWFMALVGRLLGPLGHFVYQAPLPRLPPGIHSSADPVRGAGKPGSPP